MNPLSIASIFSIQKISKRHLLIRSDEHIHQYMKFNGARWSKTYQGWIVNENDEIDLIQMHLEILDKMKDKKISRLSPYEKLKRGEDFTSSDETSDEDYVTYTDSSSEDEVIKKITNNDRMEESSRESSENESSEQESDESSDEDYIPTENSDTKNSDTKNKEPRVFQFYKKGILAFGNMSKKEQDKLDAIWNKYLNGWIIRKSYLDKLTHLGWSEIENEGQDKLLKLEFKQDKSLELD